MMYMLRKGSRNGMNEERNHDEFRKNYHKLIKLPVPHMDTVNSILKQIESEQLTKLMQELVKVLMNKRVFHKFRLLKKYFLIAIDGTGVFKFDEEPYEGCPYKTSKSETVTYSQNVVEAKLICSNGFSISIASEWINNEDGKNKQDCEYNATMRLMAKLKEAFVRLPICLVMDGLYLKHPVQQAITQYGWEYIMVWKDKTLYALQDEIQHRDQNGEIQYRQYTKVHNSISRSEYDFQFDEKAMKLRDLDVYFVKGVQTKKNLKSNNEDKVTRFVFMTSIPVTEYNYRAIFEAGRLRWKIENEGFNAQKNHGFELHHKMNRKNLNAIKNYYTCLQIAHLFSQLLTLSKNSVCKIFGTIKMLWENFLSLLRMIDDFEPVDFTNKKFNIRY